MTPGTSSFEARTFGRYTLIARLAVGGIAEIFLARLDAPGGFEKLYVLKRILPHCASDPAFVRIFLNEARIAARISHPNVCQVFELGEVAGQYFIAMEYLDGVSLLRFISEDAALDPRLVAGIMIQAAEGLHHAHQLRNIDGSSAEMVHRDVSPQNLFVTGDGVAKILDFGIARAQDATTRIRGDSPKGKCAYLAPEQLRGELVDARTDVFALGIVAWELLAGRHLFQRETDYLVFMAITHERIPSVREIRAQIPTGLAQALAIALSQDRDTRYHTARAFGEALARSVEPLGGPLAPSAIAADVEQRFAAELEEVRRVVSEARQRRVPAPASEVDPALLGGAEEDDDEPPDTTVVGRSTFWGRNALVAVSLLLAGLVLGAGGVGIGLRATRDAAPAPPRAAGPPAAVAPAPTPPEAPAPVAAPPLVVETPAARPAAAPRAAAPAPLGETAAAPVKPGYLTVVSEPIYAVIYVNGRRLGETPLVRYPLRPGFYLVKAVTPTGATQEFRVQILSGREAPQRRLAWGAGASNPLR